MGAALDSDARPSKVLAELGARAPASCGAMCAASPAVHADSIWYECTDDEHIKIRCDMIHVAMSYYVISIFTVLSTNWFMIYQFTS